MQDDPYVSLLKLMDKRSVGVQPTVWRFGVVVAPPPGMTVRIADTLQYEDSLMLNPEINYKEMRSGDRLLVVPYDNDNKFLVVCRVG